MAPSASQCRPRLGCFLGTRSPSLRPESLYPFVLHRPSLLAQQRRDAAIAVTSEA